MAFSCNNDIWRCDTASHSSEHLPNKRTSDCQRDPNDTRRLVKAKQHYFPVGNDCVVDTTSPALVVDMDWSLCSGNSDICGTLFLGVRRKFLRRCVLG